MPYDVIKALKASVFCASGLALSGCAFWPELSSEMTTKQQLEAEKKSGVSRTMRGQNAIEEANFDDAMQYAYYTMDELTRMHQNAGGLSRGTSYIATALGIGAGSAVMFGASEVVLKGLALGGASLLGIYSAANAEGQRKVLVAGEDAVLCVIAAANANVAAVNNLAIATANLANSKPQVVAAFANASRNANTYLGLRKTQRVAAAAARASNDPSTIADQEIDSSKDRLQSLVSVPLAVAADLPPNISGPTKVETVPEYLQQKSAENHAELREKTLNLLTTLAAQSADLPRYVVDSVRRVRYVVARQLADTAPDPSSIMDARRDAIIKGAADLTAKAKAVDAAGKPSTPGAPGATGGGAVVNASGFAGDPATTNNTGRPAGAAAADAVAIANLQLISKIAADATKPIDQVFQTCVDKATVAAAASAQDAAKKKE